MCSFFGWFHRLSFPCELKLVFATDRTLLSRELEGEQGSRVMRSSGKGSGKARGLRGVRAPCPPRKIGQTSDPDGILWALEGIKVKGRHGEGPGGREGKSMFSN